MYERGTSWASRQIVRKTVHIRTRETLSKIGGAQNDEDSNESGAVTISSLRLPYFWRATKLKIVPIFALRASLKNNLWQPKERNICCSDVQEKHNGVFKCSLRRRGSDP